MEQTRRDRRSILTIAPLGTAVVFLSVIIVAVGHDLTYTIAIYAFALAIPILSLIAFLTLLQDATALPPWWEAWALKLLLLGYGLVVIGIGALLYRLGGPVWWLFAAICVWSLSMAARALMCSSSAREDLHSVR